MDNGERMLTFGYRSRASAGLGQRGMFRLVDEISRRNRDRNVRGLLIHRDGQFKEFLEGNPEVMSELMPSILMDGRHNEIEVVGVRLCSEIMFTRWHCVGFEEFGIPTELLDPEREEFEKVVEAMLDGATKQS